MSALTKRCTLDWKGELRLDADAGDGRRFTIDGNSREGPSPMEALLISLAGCMAIDLAVILNKGRAGLSALSAEIEGTRAESEPRRFTSIRLHYVVKAGSLRDGQVERAIQLSRGKYCSVWNSMRPDIDFQITHSIQDS